MCVLWLLSWMEIEALFLEGFGIGQIRPVYTGQSVVHGWRGWFFSSTANDV